MIKIVVSFLIGFLTCSLVFGAMLFYEDFSLTGLVVSEGILPSDFISNDDVVVLPDRVVLWVENVSLASYKNTGSMYPILGEFSNGLNVVPKEVGELNVGDVISFRLDNTVVVHRIFEKGVDGKGVYFLTKGDNNEFEDFKKVRFEDIESVLVGILY